MRWRRFSHRGDRFTSTTCSSARPLAAWVSTERRLLSCWTRYNTMIDVMLLYTHVFAATTLTVAVCLQRNFKGLDEKRLFNCLLYEHVWCYFGSWFVCVSRLFCPSGRCFGLMTTELDQSDTGEEQRIGEYFEQIHCRWVGITQRFR